MQHHVEGIVSNMDDYLRIRPRLFPDHGAAIAGMAPWAERQRKGEAVVWITLEGFFWFPRTLMGFEKLMLAFYDQPELIHRINQDLLEFNLRPARPDRPRSACRPSPPIAEDMSYNHGPMISRRIFDEFVAPYYRQIVPRLKEMKVSDDRRYRRRRDAAGALAPGYGRRRRAAAGAPGRRGRHGAARAVPIPCAWSAITTRWS